jgi:uncharacterized protein
LQKHLVIFAKEPRIGRVKTRLAREMGKVAAWRFYRSMVHNVTRKLNKKGPWKTWLAVSPDASARNRRLFNNPTVRLIAQGSGDLGQRMLSPAINLPHGAFLVIGTDVAGIRPHLIRKAFKVLGHHDAVFGPATDGGFWLVGLKRHPILANPYSKAVRWSHSETLNDCLKQLKSQKIGFVDRLSDVDTLSDLKLMKERYGTIRDF